MAFTHKVRIHTGQNRERDRDREEMGCMKLCESFHITPEPEHVPRPIDGFTYRVTIRDLEQNAYTEAL